jgi:hypothetical protein
MKPEKIIRAYCQRQSETQNANERHLKASALRGALISLLSSGVLAQCQAVLTRYPELAKGESDLADLTQIDGAFFELPTEARETLLNAMQ